MADRSTDQSQAQQQEAAQRAMDQQSQLQRDRDNPPAAIRDAINRQPSASDIQSMARDAASRPNAVYNQTNDTPRTGKTPSFKRGGTMKRKGVARLHRGEKAAGRKSKGR